jgi:hypothetical protein
MSEHVILAEARGPDGGALKVAWRLTEAPGPNEKQDATAQVTGLYRRIYGEWPEHPVVNVRDETTREKKTFR